MKTLAKPFFPRPARPRAAMFGLQKTHANDTCYVAVGAGQALPPNLEELDLTGKGTVEVPKWATLENESRTIRQSDWA